MREGGALAGVRVLDWCDESGRLAGKLLAEGGADVVRLRRAAPGAALAGAPGARGGVLDWWYDAGCARLPLDLEAAADRDVLRDLAARADVLLETAPPARRAALGLDPAELRIANPSLVHVSLTPYGPTGLRSHYRASDLVAAALGGVLAVSGTPEQPINVWGRQSFNTAGFYAAIAAAAGLLRARAGEGGVHVDLSLVQAVASCTEQVLMYWFHQSWYPGGAAPRQGSLHWTGLYEVLACADGHVLLAVAPSLGAFVEWIVADGAAGSLAAAPPSSAAEAYARAREIMDQARRWAAGKSASEFAAEAQRRSLAFGEVRDVASALACPQLGAREFFRPVAWDGPALRVPHPLFRLGDDPAPPPAPPPKGALSVGGALERWPGSVAPAPATGAPETASERNASDPTKPLAGLRVLDFTWVLAGPYATRIFADLGADVIKIQTEPRSQGGNSNELPFFVMWNRGKRGVTLDMGHPRASETFRRLVERSDVVIDNFTSGVLDRWGVGFERARSWNPRVIYVAMSGCGDDGPWRDHVTYAPTIHALCGLTELSNPAGRRDVGPGISHSDHASGLAAALAVLEALTARRRSGTGQRIELSQLEVGAYLVGPAYIDRLAGGETARAGGNRDGFEDLVPNEVYRCARGGWLAVTARDDGEWRTLCEVMGAADLRDAADLATVSGRRAARAAIDDRIASWASRTDATAAMRTLQEHGVPAGVVQGAEELVRADEQLAASGWLVELPHATLERQTVDRFPGWFDGRPVDPPRAAPALGEHNFEVYGELLGMSELEVAEAIADGLFA